MGIVMSRVMPTMEQPGSVDSSVVPKASGCGPSSCALGPHSVKTLDAQHLCTASFVSATIYYPENSDGKLPSIVIVPGHGCGEQVMAAWGPFYASHGIVAMTIGTPAPWSDFPGARCQTLLDASRALQSEDLRDGSVLKGCLDTESRAVQGYSWGGGGAQLAAIRDEKLKCIVALCPSDESSDDPQAQYSTSVPVLIICGEKDTSNGANPWDQYPKISATKLIFEVAGGDHFVANGPAGGTEHEAQHTASDCGMLCNYVCGTFCGCAPCFGQNVNGPSGYAKDNAPRGAIGGMALAWLQLFLLGNENARSQLAIKPDIATRFESTLV